MLVALPFQWRTNRGFRRFKEPGPRAPGGWGPRLVGPQNNFRQDSYRRGRRGRGSGGGKGRAPKLLLNQGPSDACYANWSRPDRNPRIYTPWQCCLQGQGLASCVSVLNLVDLPQAMRACVNMADFRTSAARSIYRPGRHFTWLVFSLQLLSIHSRDAVNS